MKLFSLLALTLLLQSCGQIFYYPTTNDYGSPRDKKLKFKERFIESDGGTKLHTFEIKPKKKIARPSTILHFHGNAENMTSHYNHVAWLAKAGHHVITFDYRGYGKSSGTPHKKGIHQDAKVMINHAIDYHKKNKTKNFVIIAQSLGGIISLSALIDLQKNKEVSLLVLDSAFSSYQRITFDKLTDRWFLIPFSPLAYILVSDTLSPHNKLNELRPIQSIVIHGKSDKVVPFKFGLEIYDQLPEPKNFWIIEEGNHTDAFSLERKDYRKKLLDKISNLKKNE